MSDLNRLNNATISELTCKIERLEMVLEWFSSFVDAIEKWDNKLYNNACKYADEIEEGCI